MDKRSNWFLSRRVFLSAFTGLMSGISLLRPKALMASKPELKNLLGRIELETLTVTPPLRQNEIICRSLGNSARLYKKSDGKEIPFFNLNMAGKIIWEACDGKNSPRDISDLIYNRFKVTHNLAWLDTITFIARLKIFGAIL